MPIDSGNLALKGLDDLFSTEENRQEEQREQVQQIPIDELHPFTNHPFKVLDDEAMTRTVESIAQYGVLAPLIARPRPDGNGYEIISGHRRQYAAKLAGLDTLPVIVRQMSDDAAVILLSGEVKPTAAEIASVARAPPEERPALVAEICKPKDQKKAAAVETTSSPAAKPLSDSSTSEEECTDEELVHTPAPQEQTFPQRVNESLKIDRQQILEIANSRYVPKRLADGTAMLCEVSGAANSMMRRWESVFREYPDILSDAENRASVERTIQKLRDYLKNLEDKMEELL